MKRAKPSPQWAAEQQDVWQQMAVSSSQEQDGCTTKETRATVASLPEWDEDSGEETCE